MISHRWPLPLVSSVLALLILASMSIAGFSAKARIPWSDEGQFSSAAYNLAHRGSFGTTVLEPTSLGLTRIHERTYWIMPLFLLGQAAWYEVFPPSLFWTRAFSLFWVPFAVVAFFIFLVRIFHDQRIGLLGAGLLALDYHFMDNAGFARPELMCLALGLGSFAVYLGLRDTRFRTALFCSNLLLAASVLSHPNGILFCAGIVIVVLWFDRSRLTVQDIFVATLPHLILGSMYGLYVWQDPVAWMDQLRGNSSGRVTPSLNPFRLVGAEILQRYAVGYGFATGGMALLKAPSILSLLAGVVCAISIPSLRRQSAVRLVLLLLTTFFAIQCVFNQKLTYYLVDILPLYIAVFSCVVCYLWDTLSRSQAIRIALVAVVAALPLIASAGVLGRARQRSYVAGESRVLSFVRQHDTGSKVIFGSAALLYGMNFDARLVDDLLLGGQSGKDGDLVILNELYWDTYKAWRDMNHPKWSIVAARLKHYVVVYDNDGYQVLAPKGAAGTPLEVH